MNTEYDLIDSMVMSKSIADSIRSSVSIGDETLHPMFSSIRIIVSKYMGDNEIVCLDERGNCIKVLKIINKGKEMYFATENWLDTKEKIEWYFRKKSIWTRVKEFFFGVETVDHHFGTK